MASFGTAKASNGKSEQSVKVFSMKIVFFTNSRNFSPLKVSRYMVLCLHYHGNQNST